MPLKKPYFHCKPGVDVGEITMLHPNLFLILAFVVHWANAKGLNCVWTSFLDHAPNREYGTHAQGRAADLRTRDWPRWAIEELRQEINARFMDVAAISARTGLPRAAVYHKVEGGEYHLHLQVKP